MQTAERVPDETPLRPSPDGVSASAVHLALEAIVASQPFRTSRQCQNMLRYIVDHSLRGDDMALRERMLGVEVFGRAADYDTSEDPVVRMRAADVRKRLAQFYQSLDAEASALHIELKPGSYRATFQYGRSQQSSTSVAERTPVPSLSAVKDPPGEMETAEREPAAARRRISLGLHPWRVLLALGVLAGLAVLLWRSEAPRWASPQKRFWAPLTASKKPVLLYLGSNVAYRFTPEFQARYQREHGLRQNGPEFFIDLPPNGTVQTSDLVPVPSTFVTVGDLAASTQIVSLLNGWAKPFVLRSADDLSIGDLRNTPAVLIGGFNNRWTLETTEGLPFSFRAGTEIRDRDRPDRVWTIGQDGPGQTREDYALISRLWQAKTGGPAITVSGIGSYGTEAAAEFVTSEEKVSAMLKDAPAGWERKNFQAVLRIRVVAYAPVAVEVVTTAWW